MSYVLKKNGAGLFVTPPGSAASYTPDLRRARRYETKEAAERDACGNETAIAYDQA